MLVRKMKKAISFAIAVVMVFTLAPQLVSAADYTSKKWAVDNISDLLSRKMIEADENGNIGADLNMTRGEFFKAINSVLGFTEVTDVNFTDLTEDNPYYVDVKKAGSQCYVAGFVDGTVGVDQQITRAQAARVLGVALEITPDPSGAQNYNDADEIAEWYVDYVGELTNMGILAGVGNNMFAPNLLITRVEAFAMAWRAENTTIIRVGATEEPFGSDDPENITVTDKNIILTEDGAVVQNLKTTGYITVHESVGNGSVTIDNVEASAINIYGGGANSVHMINSKAVKIQIDDKTGKVRLHLSGDISISELTFFSGGHLQAEGDKVKLDSVTVDAPKSDDENINSAIKFDGKFAETKIELVAVGSVIEVISGIIGNVVIAEKAKGSSIEIAKEAIVKILEVLAAATVGGSGTVESATVASNDVEFSKEVAVEEVEVLENVETPVITKPETPVTETPSGGGGGATTPTKTNAEKLIDDVNTAIANAVTEIKSSAIKGISEITYAKSSKTLTVKVATGVNADEVAPFVGAKLITVLDKYSGTIETITVDGKEIKATDNLLETALEVAKAMQGAITGSANNKTASVKINFKNYGSATVNTSAEYKINFSK